MEKRYQCQFRVSVLLLTNGLILAAESIILNSYSPFDMLIKFGKLKGTSIFVLTISFLMENRYITGVHRCRVGCSLVNKPSFGFDACSILLTYMFVLGDIFVDGKTYAMTSWVSIN